MRYVHIQITRCFFCIINYVFVYVHVDQRWRQQQIPACRPVFSATHVFFWFSVIGLVFIALGIAFTVILSDVSSDLLFYLVNLAIAIVVCTINVQFKILTWHVLLKSEFPYSANTFKPPHLPPLLYSHLSLLLFSFEKWKWITLDALQ